MTRSAFAWGALAPLVTAACFTCGCPGPSRDVVPESRDVRGAAGDGGLALAPDAYQYVAKRRRGLVALAEARGLGDADARAAIDHLADELDACAARLAAEGKLAEDGAGRVVAAIGPDGAIAGLNVKAGPGAQTAANLLVCVVSPLKLVAFPPAPAGADAGARGLALEAVWGSGR